MRCLFKRSSSERGGLLLLHLIPAGLVRVAACSRGCAAALSAPWPWGRLGAWPQAVAPMAGVCVCKNPPAKFPPPCMLGMYFIMALDCFQMSGACHRGKSVCKGSDARVGLSSRAALLQVCWALSPFWDQERRASESWWATFCTAPSLRVVPLLCRSLPRKTTSGLTLLSPYKVDREDGCIGGMDSAPCQRAAICWQLFFS